MDVSKYFPAQPLSSIVHRGGNNFDLIRLITASMVVISHAFVIVTGTGEDEPLASVSVYTLAQHAVNVFFFLSGVLVSASLERSSSVSRFLYSRFLRIFPGLFVCILLVTFLMGPLVTKLNFQDYFSSATTIQYVFKTLFLTTGIAELPGVFGELPMRGQINIPLWSLKYEMMCYAALAVLGALGIWRRDHLFWCFIGSLFLVYGILETRHTKVDDHVALDQLLRFGLCFFLGATAYKARELLPLSPLLALAFIILLLASRNTPIEEIVSYFAVGYLVLYLASIPIDWLRKITSKADLSYGIYIYGWPIGQVVLLIEPAMGPILLAVISLILASLLAGLSWRFVEKPALRFKQSINVAHTRLSKPRLLRY